MLQRNKACNNCRRRKIKCNGHRPCCSQCALLPGGPKAASCEYLAPTPKEGHQTPRQLLEHIQVLKAQIQELQELRQGEEIKPPILLYSPYGPNSDSTSNPTTPEPTIDPSTLEILGPPMDLITTLVSIFLDRFAESVFFFLDVRTLPLGRPVPISRTLINVIALWACVISPSVLCEPYTENTLLRCALRSLPQDIAEFMCPLLAIQIIQAEVLLSCYFLHAGRPVEGRTHCVAAVSLALDAGLHALGASSLPRADAYPAFPLAQPALPPATDPEQAAERVNAFWAVWVLNNYWVAFQGTPSAISRGLFIDTPWSGGVLGGATIAQFLDGNDQEGFTSVALLAKASTLLERVVTFCVRTTEAPEPLVYGSFAARLQIFHATLPPLPGDTNLVIAHALTDLAIVRLHAPYAHASEPIRSKFLAAAARIVANLNGLCELGSVHTVVPVLVLVGATICNVYRDELAALREGEIGASLRTQQDIEAQFSTLMSAMSAFAATSPVAHRSFTLTL
ncbi:hypothetical protein B0H15DRAFT_991666 [Mycena belliarum]|uniref:Zn(2)-C6 fungal-type domain-containing protein n=1 Tax=Mycena belliarum TaxID=1033014 RepID=A0AAD6XV61_9AGAR|nr:hypothetical protein B0H15DRAFT_991666 [Mycena belliae]